jgi:hypothetical protein
VPARPKLYLEQLVDIRTQQFPQLSKYSFEEQVKILAYEYSKVSDIYIDSPPTSQLSGKHDLIIMSNFLLSYSMGLSKVYKVAERFGQHLLKTNLDVPCECLSTKMGQSFLFELPFTLKSTDGSQHRTVVVAVTGWHSKPGIDIKSVTKEEESMYQDKAIAILAPDYSPEGQVLETSTYFVSPLRPGATIEQTIQENVMHMKGSLLSMDLIRLVAKLLLYIDSGEPDLVAEPVVACLTKKPKKLRQHWRDHCPFETISVGYSYHGRLYSKDASQVSGHFRWQTYGPERSKVKLIWIDEHVRHYKPEQRKEHAGQPA